ncbi:hypothetical protein CCR94_09570 [Rhodoblastus sphagnicola]|uniref:Uncharacterized protein n=1 Tax=Rhodoblastus sphagnicola TaxID=333368 RepID=A0A2S6N9K6_9HYPH|nr:phosphopantetheine-binding protein [Rhodoblastus sphagnicola]MBB4200413.1 acyl carrier protein [Rhodoblastus sphagnicola]PPQ31290.1 hypothetical protein CCR94_09570 [Rhodoblastus sphagnicola]
MNQISKIEIDDTSIREPIRNFLLDNFLLGSGAELEDDTPLMEAGILDSTGVVELVSFIEDTFEIMISDHEITADNFNSISKMANFVWNISK